MADEMYEEYEEDTLPTIPFGMKAGIFSGAMTAVTIADLVGHLGVSGFVIGTILAGGATKFGPAAVNLVKEQLPPEVLNGLSKVRRRLNRRAGDELEDEDEYYEEDDEEYEDDELGDEEGLAAFREEWMQAKQATLPIPRVTIEAIVARVKPNSFWIYIGRSLTHPNHRVEAIDFRAQHIKIIGRTQMGKSSMTALLLEVITRTHDPKHVQISLLDLEHKTSRLFADLPHVATWQGRKLHAKSEEEVIEHLGYLLEILQYRYTLSEAEVDRLPYLIIYMEEFLALKKELQTKKETAPTKEERDTAAASYGILVNAINKIALRGLKVHMQFLLCAQVSYADKSFRDALAMFGYGFSFCVKPTAAQAAGFTEYELLKQNYTDSLKGSAVMEADGRQAIILAPEYDLHQRLIDHAPPVSARSSRSPLHKRDLTDCEEDLDLEESEISSDFKGETESERKVLAFSRNEEKQPLEQPDLGTEERPETEKEYRFTETEILQFAAAYRAVGNIEKALASMKKGGRYKAHAREIIQTFNLRNS